MKFNCNSSLILSTLSLYLSCFISKVFPLDPIVEDSNIFYNKFSTQYDFPFEDLPFDTPTPDEIQRGFLVRAPAVWGRGIRLERSLRILLLGGSNTAQIEGYAGYLGKEMEAWKQTRKIHSSSYVLNNGHPGSDPTDLFYKKLKFEDSFPVELWPNVVSLEYTVNDEAEWAAAKRLDKLIHVLNKKWEAQGLPRPSYLILTFFTVGPYFSMLGRFSLRRSMSLDVNEYFNSPKPKGSEEQQIEQEVQKLNPSTKLLRLLNGNIASSDGFGGGQVVSIYYLALARFHRYPVLSMGDAMFPSFTRYFVNSVVGQADHRNQAWPFTRDGMHISPLGEAFLVKKLILPFLESELNRSEPLKLAGSRSSWSNISPPTGNVSNSIGTGISSGSNGSVSSPEAGELSLFASGQYSTHQVLASFSSWGSADNQLRDIVVPTPGWHFQSLRGHEQDREHVCYGANSPMAREVAPLSNSSLVQPLVPPLSLSSASAATPEPTPELAPALFMLHYSSAVCNTHSPCGLEVSYVHSWNTSYIGDARCFLYHFQDTDGNSLPTQWLRQSRGGKVGADANDEKIDALLNVKSGSDWKSVPLHSNRNPQLATLDGHLIAGNTVNGKPLHDTTVHTHTLTRKLTSGGDFLLECHMEPQNLQQPQQKPSERKQQQQARKEGTKKEWARQSLLSCFAAISMLVI